MTAPSDAPHQLVDHFFRHEAGRLVAALVRRFGPARLPAIEDAVQEALMQAMAGWAQGGVPDTPSAWLTSVAHNRLLDGLRRAGTAARWTPQPAADVHEPPPARLGGEIDDDLLRMLFVCCDPELPPQGQLVVALKLLCGFGTREIAAGLFLTDANVQKILTRGRDRLRQLGGDGAGADPGEPGAAWADLDGARLAERVEAVQRVLYLMFNEATAPSARTSPSGASCASRRCACAACWWVTPPATGPPRGRCWR